MLKNIANLLYVLGALLTLAIVSGAGMGHAWAEIVNVFILLTAFAVDAASRGAESSWRSAGPHLNSQPVWKKWSVAGVLTFLFGALYFGSDAFVSPSLRLVDDAWSAIGREASRWTLYGLMYTLLVVGFGFRAWGQYRHHRRQRRRYFSLISVQLIFAFLIPLWLESWLEPGVHINLDFKHMWPLNASFFEPWHLDAIKASGAMGRMSFLTGLLMFLVVAPWATWRWGKGWYCSWVCGCGALAETAGDQVRHLNSPKREHWKIERFSIYAVLLWIVMSTGVVIFGYVAGQSSIWGLDIYNVFTRPYSFVVSSLFSGVLGVGLYPVLGNRFWCRFGCPLAAYMGLIQRWKSRFRIEVDAGACISCNACSAACEMGINVKDYAERGEPVVRASCVGCGLCEAACPRSVLHLATDKVEIRINDSKNPSKIDVT
jgi:ferredoxin